MLSRRRLVVGALAAGSLFRVRAAGANDRNARLRRAVLALERRHGGRLGVAITDTASNNEFAFRGGERFALCSTHKLLTAAFVLARIDRKQESLSRRVIYRKKDLVAYSPITAKNTEKDMTIGNLCEAALPLSDNTAANLLRDSFGGPIALTAYLRSLGDTITRLDRREPALNENKPGDPRDTTTPLAMLGTMRKLVLGSALSAPLRAQLAAWMVACKTGDKRLRAGAPNNWRVGDKSGSGAHNAANDVAIMWPPRRAPIIVTAYYTGSSASNDERDAVLADIGRLAAGS